MCRTWGRMVYRKVGLGVVRGLVVVHLLIITKVRTHGNSCYWTRIKRKSISISWTISKYDVMALCNFIAVSGNFIAVSSNLLSSLTTLLSSLTTLLPHLSIL